MYLKLFTSCKVTQGANCSLISDVQRGLYFNIPNTFFDIIKKLEKKPIKNIENEYDNENKLIFNSYISFIIDNEFGFITDEPNNFIYSDIYKINKPSMNFILDFQSADKIDSDFILQLEIINTEALHINFYSKIDLNWLVEVLDQILKLTSIRYFSILFMYDENLKEEELKFLGYRYPFFGKIVIYSSPFEKDILDDFIKISYLFENKICEKSCGIIHSSYFSCNNRLYSESHEFNSCLAGKISIDVDGNIKNCPSMSQSFGNIKDITLEEALYHKDFKKYWNLTKDKIEVCKDCEFRYICTDCRAYTEKTHTNEEGLDTSKPLKCGYNPYTGEWEEWSTNPLKQKAIQFYGMQDLIKRNEN